MINTNGGSLAQEAGLNMRSYVLDEYKDLLFPKKMSKYEKQHAEVMERK